MRALSLQGDQWRGPGRETLGDHLMYLAGYAAMYVLFVTIQVMVFNAHRTGKGAGIEFVVIIGAIPFLIGFVPMWLFSRFCLAGRSGLLRHAVVGVLSGLAAVGFCYGLTALGWFV